MKFQLNNQRLCLGLALGLALVMNAAARADVIRVGGTGSSGGIVRLLGAEFSKTNTADVVQFVDGLGSGGGIRALRERATQLAVASRPLTDAEAKGLQVTYLASTPLVLAVRKGVKTRSVTEDQLRRIYDGSMVTWPDGTAIRPILRPRNDIDTKLLAGISPRVAAALETAYGRKGIIEAPTDDRAADLLEKTQGSFGPTTLGMILSESRDLAPVMLDGVEPSTRNLIEGKYRLYKVLSVVSDPAVTSGATTRFLKFMETPAARALLERTGHVVSQRLSEASAKGGAKK